MRALIYILGPVLFLLAVLCVWAVLLPACAAAPLLGRIFPGHCPAPGPSVAQSALADELARGRALSAQIRVLERELDALDTCVEAPRYERPAPPERRAEVAPEQIDPDRWAAGDIGLIEGCWLLDSDYNLVVSRTGEEVTVPHWRACFDAEGNGQQEFRLSNGVECKGPLNATFDGDGDGRMTLRDGAAIPCTQSFQINERTGICTLDATQTANCALTDRAGVTNATLRRDQ